MGTLRVWLGLLREVVYKMHTSWGCVQDTLSTIVSLILGRANARAIKGLMHTIREANLDCWQISNSVPLKFHIYSVIMYLRVVTQTRRALSFLGNAVATHHERA